MGGVGAGPPLGRNLSGVTLEERLSCTAAADRVRRFTCRGSVIVSRGGIAPLEATLTGGPILIYNGAIASRNVGIIDEKIQVASHTRRNSLLEFFFTFQLHT